MKMNNIKHILATLSIATAVTLAVPVSTQAFTVRWVHSRAPQGANRISDTTTWLATGKSYAILNCTKYASQIKKEAYLTEKTVNSNWKITSVPIRSTGKKKLYFTGSGRPKKGVMIQFRLNLNGYGDGNPATISGQM